MKTNGIPTVRDLLSEGFGAEGIALKLRVPADYVRSIIANLRARGDLATIYHPQKQRNDHG